LIRLQEGIVCVINFQDGLDQQIYFSGIEFVSEYWDHTGISLATKSFLILSNPMSNANQIPPASFPMLVSTLGAQAMTALGQIENPLTKKKEVNLELAKHVIDTLEILSAKTKGNLSSEETAMLEAVTHELRMAYLAAKK
jgi:hypothetical protein